MKRKMSLAFLLLAGYVLLSLGNILNVVTGVVSIFRNFNIAAVLNYAVNVAAVLVPVALLVLLYLNDKKDIKKVAWIVLLMGGILKLYYLVRTVMNSYSMMMAMYGGVDLISLLPMAGQWISGAMTGILMVVGALNIKDGKNRKLIPIALIGGFFYLLFTGAGILTGSLTIMTMLRDLILMIALCVLPGTFNNYETSVKADGAGLKVVAIVLAVVMVVMVAAAAATDSGSSHRGGDGVNTCRICGRETSLVVGFGMCGECYYDFNDWLDGD